MREQTEYKEFDERMSRICQNCGERWGSHCGEECPNEKTTWKAAPGASPQPSQARETCEWTLDDDESGTWSSSCGELWSFIDGGPKENRVTYCHHCGKLAAINAKAVQPSQVSAINQLCLLVEQSIDLLESSPTSSGVCYCGDSMKTHAAPMTCGHVAIDSGDDQALNWIAKARAAIGAFVNTKEQS